MKKTLLHHFLMFLWLSCFAATTPTLAETKVLLKNGDVSSWVYHKFTKIPPTDYETVEDEEIGAVLAANSSGGASGYILKRDINLDKTPWLHFRWRVDFTGGGFDERVLSGDDFVIRIYLSSHGLIKYRTIALVRAQGNSGASWESPYSGLLNQTYIHAFAGGDSPLGEWQTTSINVAELWRNLFDSEPKIMLIGLMTDGDNTDSVMKAKYGEIMLSDSPALPF